MKRYSIRSRLVLILLCLAIPGACFYSCVSKEGEDIPTTEAETTATTSIICIERVQPWRFEAQDARILAAEENKWHFWAEDNSEDLLKIKIAIYNRNAMVEERSGATLVWEMKPCSSLAERDAFVQSVEISAQSGAQYDAVHCPSNLASALAMKHLCTDLLQAKYIDLDMPWWSSAYVSEMRYQNQLYSLVENDGIGLLSSLSCVFFNNDIIKEKSLISPYYLMENNLWTVGALREQVKECYDDLNENGERDAADLYGMCSLNDAEIAAWFYGAGGRLSTRNAEGQMRLLAGEVEGISGIVMELAELLASPNCYETTDAQAMFKANRLCFMTGVFHTPYEILLDVNDIINYGVAPLPKQNGTQDRYYTHVADTYEVWIIPVGAQSVTDSSGIIENMGAEAYRQISPVYLDLYLKLRFAPDERLADIYDLIRNSVTFDYVHLYRETFEADPEASLVGCVKAPDANRWEDLWPTLSESVTSDFERILTIYKK